MTRQRLRSLASMLSLWVQAFLIPHLAELDNGSDHRAGTEILQAEKSTRKSGFACSTPDMGVILWGASPLYLISVSSFERHSTKM